MATQQEFVTFGPFVPRDREPIQQYLETKGIEHRVRVDQGRAFFEIESRALLGIGDELEKFGISWKPDLPEPDFSETEFLCPDCSFAARRDDYCPLHRKRLLSPEQWQQVQRERRTKLWERRLWKFVFRLAVVSAIVVGGHKLFAYVRPWVVK